MPPPEQHLEVWLCVWLQDKRLLTAPIATKDLGASLRFAINEELRVHHFLLRVDHLDMEIHGDLVLPNTRMAWKRRLVAYDIEPRRLVRVLVAVRKCAKIN
jgi:hypothetical protein